MVEVRQAERFVRWFAGLRDLRPRAKVLARIECLIGGNPGDVKPVGADVSELRINYGPWMQGLLPAEGNQVDHPSGWRRHELTGQGH